MQIATTDVKYNALKAALAYVGTNITTTDAITLVDNIYANIEGRPGKRAYVRRARRGKDAQPRKRKQNVKGGKRRVGRPRKDESAPTT